MSCSKYYLTADQERQCRDPGNRDFVISMGQGVNVVAHYCNSTFKNRRWNCPYVGGSHPFTRIAYQGQTTLPAGVILFVFVQSFITDSIYCSVPARCCRIFYSELYTTNLGRLLSKSRFNCVVSFDMLLLSL